MSTPAAAVITAIYDRYDTLKPALRQLDPHGQPLDVDFVCVTDDPALTGDGWRIIYQPRPGLHPNRAAKEPKYAPWQYTDAEASVWVDASFRITSPAFTTEALRHVTSELPIAQFVHPWRDCLYDEAAASAHLPKYADEPIIEQVNHYRGRGHPEHWGLWATGVIARRHTPTVGELGALWQAETDRWSFQDQLSHPYALRQTGLRPEPLPGTHLDNPWLTYEGSGRH